MVKDHLIRVQRCFQFGSPLLLAMILAGVGNAYTPQNHYMNTTTFSSGKFRAIAWCGGEGGQRNV